MTFANDANHTPDSEAVGVGKVVGLDSSGGPEVVWHPLRNSDTAKATAADLVSKFMVFGLLTGMARGLWLL